MVQIYKLALPSGERSVLTTGAIICGIPGAHCPNGTYAGPQGLVLYTDINDYSWLLVVIGHTVLVKVDTITGASSIVAPGYNTNPNSISIDGMVLQNLGPLNSILYAAGIYANDGVVQVLTSTNAW